MSANENTYSNHEALRARAIALREAGRSNPEIRAELGISGWTLTALLQGHVEPVHENLANRAKPQLRAQARDLREQGWSYDAIARKLRVSKSSLSLWLRDLPKPEAYHPGEPPQGWKAEEWADFCARRREIYRRRKAEERRQEVMEAAGDVGELSDRELWLVGVMIYWCEGAKSKPWRRQKRADFINSDPQLVQLYVRFLAHLGYPVDQLILTVHIHENADVDAATRFWAEIVGASLTQFNKPTIKKHKPSTTRRKVGDHYRGALRIDVRKSAKLYRRVEGWARGVMLGSEAAVADIAAAEEPPW